MARINEEVGERVHRAMWRRKVSQAQVARVLGVAQPAMSRKIRGVRPWTVAELLMVSKALGVPPADLLPEDAEELGAISVLISQNGAAENRCTPALVHLTRPWWPVPPMVARHAAS